MTTTPIQTMFDAGIVMAANATTIPTMCDAGIFITTNVYDLLMPLASLFLGAVVFVYLCLALFLMLVNTDHTVLSLLKMNGGRSRPPVAPFGMFECIHNMTSDQQPWFPLRARKALNVDTFVLPLPRRPVMTGDYALAREILTDPLSIKPRVYQEFEPLGVGNIFTRNGTFWHVRRKGAAPAFSLKHVKRMNQVALERTEKWIRDVLIPCTKEGKSFDVSKEMISITLEAICWTAFEYEISEDEKVDFINNLELLLKEFLTKSINNPMRKYLGSWIPDRRKALEAARANMIFTKKIIAQYRSNPNPLKGTIIDYLANNPCYSDEELAADVLLFLTAGHDTTAYTIAFTLLQLAKHPHEQKKVRDELLAMEAAAKIKTDSRSSSYSPLPADQWRRSAALQMAIKESMRLYPVSASGSSRVCGRDFVTKEGWTIPKGTSVVSHIMMTHRNQTVFGKNADEYVPSRWENPTQAQKDSFLLFSAGKQNCVGQSLAQAQLHCIVPRILKEVELELDDPGTITWFLTLKPIGAMLKPKKATN